MVYNLNGNFFWILYQYDYNFDKKNFPKYYQELQRRFESEIISKANLKNNKFIGP